MLLDPNQISIDRSGKYQPKSCTIALVGPRMVDIDWAMTVATLRIPLHIRWKPGIYETEEAALKEWETDETTHIFLWPAGQMLDAGALHEAAAADADRVQMGKARMLKRGGNWEIPTVRGDLTVTQDEIAALPTEPILHQGLNPGRTIMIGLPSLGKVSLLWTANLLCMVGPMGANIGMTVVTGYPVDEARNLIVDKLLAMNPRPAFLLFLGDDNLPPSNGIQLLMDAMERAPVEVAAVGGLYYFKHLPPQAVAWRGDQPLVTPRDYQPGNLVEVDGIGMDFTLIKTDYLEPISTPRFKTLEDDKHVMTEDVYFWRKFRKETGLRPYCHTGCLVGHYNAKTNETFWGPGTSTVSKTGAF